MSYRFRNILFIIFFIIFLIMTSVLSLYASGYKISLESILSGKALIQKTGILVIDSKPRSADIFLSRESRGIFFDGELLKNKKIKTPSKIKNLLPGEYLLELSLDGYWPWKQKVHINPGQSTYVENIILFKQSEALMLFESNFQNISMSPNGKKIILENDSKIIDIDSFFENNFYSADKKNKVSFLDSRRAIINNELIFDYSRNRYYNLEKDFFTNAYNFKINNDDLFFLKNGLNSYNISSQKNNIIFSESEGEKIIDFYFSSDFYFLIVEQKDNSLIRIYNAKNKELFRETILAKSANYKIINNPGNSSFLYIYNDEFKNINIINSSSKVNSIWATINRVNSFSFSNLNNFIYSSDFEIYSFNTVLAENYLIARFDYQIKDIIWHPKNYIIYSTEKDIYILDLSYDSYIIKIASLDKISNLVLDRLGSVLYFSAKSGDEEGIFKLFIQ